MSVVNPELVINNILEGASKLDSHSLSHLAQEIHQLIAKKKVKSLTKEETILIKKINNPIEVSLIEQFDFLHKKQKTIGLADSEYQELIDLSNQIELKDSERLEHMLELSKLWKISLKELKEKLQITPKEPYVW